MRLLFTDIIASLAAKTVSFATRVLPGAIIRASFEVIIRIVLIFQPKHLQVARTNLRIVFPDMSDHEQRKLINRHIQYLANFLYEAFRLPQITEDWVNKNVVFPEGKENFLAEASPNGRLYLTGHLGVFELLAQTMALKGFPFHFVVRKFPGPRLEQWWRSIREKHGNRVIERSGAYRKLLHVLNQGGRAGLLFDQNITLSRAVFPRWFSLPAATTKAVGYSILKANPRVTVLSLVRNTSGQYEFLVSDCQTDAIRDDPSLSREEKILAITQKVTDLFTPMIEEFPEQWFWFHRRWKTRPDGTTYQY